MHISSNKFKSYYLRCNQKREGEIRKWIIHMCLYMESLIYRNKLNHITVESETYWIKWSPQTLGWKFAERRGKSMEAIAVGATRDEVAETDIFLFRLRTLLFFPP